MGADFRGVLGLRGQLEVGFKLLLGTVEQFRLFECNGKIVVDQGVGRVPPGHRLVGFDRLQKPPVGPIRVGQIENRDSVVRAQTHHLPVVVDGLLVSPPPP